ncbi:MAG: metallophosphoesterase family protein [Verrucomicrobiota bacterium]
MKKVKYGIFSDIHSNLEALKAVVTDMHEQGVTHPVCLGDVVGYNANPRECLTVVRAMRCPIIRGNHDEIVSTRSSTENFNALAGEGIAYSKRSLSIADKEFLSELPMVLKVKGITFVHASLDDPEHWNYVNSDLEAESSFTYQQAPSAAHSKIPYQQSRVNASSRQSPPRLRH